MWFKGLDIINVILLLLLFVRAIKAYPKLPQKIPTHFNLYLEPDAWGSRVMIFFLPTLAGIILSLFMLVLPKSEPNLIVPITPENREVQLYMGDLMMKLLLLVILVLKHFLLSITICTEPACRKWFKPYIITCSISIFIIPLVYTVLSYIYK
ncbi:DUF1648 domain-containing protein [Riemerella anatipestifer]|nr:DUF1648 domain-containing protein [Riemerella anatipestifer]